MALFYTDEHVPSAVVDVLRVLGHDVLTAWKTGGRTRASVTMTYSTGRQHWAGRLSRTTAGTFADSITRSRIMPALSPTPMTPTGPQSPTA